MLVFPFHLLDPSSLLLPMPRGQGPRGKEGQLSAQVRWSVGCIWLPLGAGSSVRLGRA